MAKVDRLGWAAGLSFECHGVRAGFRVKDARHLELVARRLPPGWKRIRDATVRRLYSLILVDREDGSRVRRFNLLYRDIARLERSADEEAVLDRFEADLQLHVAEHAPRKVFVHAGVVGWRGRAIVVPGRSLSGKSTLTAELVRAGAAYYSDEYAVFDRRGRVHPYPKPPALRSDSTGKQKSILVESLGGTIGTKPLPLGLVLMTRYRRGTRSGPKQVSRGRGVLGLLANTVSARRAPLSALAAFERATSGVRVLEGPRGEATELAAALVGATDVRSGKPPGGGQYESRSRARSDAACAPKSSRRSKAR